MKNVNRAEILGNLTRDPEMRTTPSGQTVTSFSVATNRRWTDPAGERKEAVEYHDIVAWGKLAEIASQILKKGQPAYVTGRLQTRSWEAQDGTRRQKTEIVADDLIALSSRGSASENQGVRNFQTEAIRDAGQETDQDQKTETENPSSAGDETEKTIDPDDIPF